MRGDFVELGKSGSHNPELHIKAQKWAISISNLEAKLKRSPDPQWQHIQNQGHVRMRSILN
jgi:hypothetical protein